MDGINISKKSHVEEVRTWIDFEQKIEEVLVIFQPQVL